MKLTESDPGIVYARRLCCYAMPRFTVSCPFLVNTGQKSVCPKSLHRVQACLETNRHQATPVEVNPHARQGEHQESINN